MSDENWDPPYWELKRAYRLVLSRATAAETKLETTNDEWFNSYQKLKHLWSSAYEEMKEAYQILDLRITGAEARLEKLMVERGPHCPTCTCNQSTGPAAE